MRLAGPGDMPETVKGSLGDFFEPPIPLLKFPMTVGDQWTWTGENLSGDLHKASAKITTSEQPTTVRVQVELALDSGTGVPAKRTMTFVFAPGRGVVRREIGESSTRIPAE